LGVNEGMGLDYLPRNDFLPLWRFAPSPSLYALRAMGGGRQPRCGAAGPPRPLLAVSLLVCAKFDVLLQNLWQGLEGSSN